jgi:hypothetical protein
MAWCYLDHRCGVLRRCMGNRRYSETTMTMFFIVRWMELSHPDIDNKFTGLITLNCSELFLHGIDVS